MSLTAPLRESTDRVLDESYGSASPQARFWIQRVTSQQEVTTLPLVRPSLGGWYLLADSAPPVLTLGEELMELRLSAAAAFWAFEDSLPENDEPPAAG